MKGIILAAGVGSRLRPMTEGKPKTLITVNNKPMISYLVDSLVNAAVDEIIICVGHMGGQIVDYVNNYNQSDVSITYVFNESYLNTNNMYSLYLARLHLVGDVILMNADLVFDLSIVKDISKQAGAVVAVDKGRYLEESMKVTVKDGLIKSISKKTPENASYGSSIDIYKFDDAACSVLVSKITDIIEVQEEVNQWTEVLLDNVMADGLIDFRPLDIESRKWYEIDDHRDLSKAELLFNENLSSLKSKKLFILDKDGTITIGTKPIARAKPFIEKLDNVNKKWVIGSNNSSKTSAQHSLALRETLKLGDITVVTSLDVAVSYFISQGYKRVYWCASEIVGQELSSKFVFDDSSPEAVLLTYDTDLTYEKLLTLISLVRAGVPYYATHIDMLCPAEQGDIPDIGTFIEMVVKATNILPSKTFGKPSAIFLEYIVSKYDVCMSDVVLIGDRLYTDIAACQNTPVTSVLVLTGETNRADYEDSAIKADIIVESIDVLMGHIL